MTQIEKCCICETENERRYYTEEVGLVEDHYNCNNCGYFREMVYSAPFEGIDIISGNENDRARKRYFSIAFKARINKLHLQIDPEWS